MYNLVKGIWHKFIKKDIDPVLTDPVLTNPVVDPVLTNPVVDPVVDPVEVVYVVLNDFEMETMVDDAVNDEDIPIEKKKDPIIVLDPISEDPISDDPIINIIVDVVLDIVSDDPTIVNVIEDPVLNLIVEDEVKKPKKAKKLKKS
jgi:hypothetical protein